VAENKTSNVLYAISHFGEMGFGDLGFGEMGFGELGFGDLGFGELGFGDLGFGELGFGEVGGHHTIICTLFKTDNHASTSSLTFNRPDALPDIQPTVSKH